MRAERVKKRERRTARAEEAEITIAEQRGISGDGRSG